MQATSTVSTLKTNLPVVLSNATFSFNNKNASRSYWMSNVFSANRSVENISRFKHR